MPHFRLILTLIILTSITQQGRCEVIGGVSIYDVSSGHAVAVNTVNGSGLVGELHEIEGIGTTWNTNIGDFIPGDNNFAHITFDLGAVYDFDEIQIWNYTYAKNGGDLVERGVKDFRVSVAGSDISPSFTPVGDFTIARARFDPLRDRYFESESVFASATGVRLVRFDIFSRQAPNRFNSPDVVGLSEVRFHGSLSSVPEPSSLGLVAVLAGVTLLRSRRSEKCRR